MKGVSRMVMDAIYHISRGSTFLSILRLLYWASLLIFTLQCWPLKTNTCSGTSVWLVAISSREKCFASQVIHMFPCNVSRVSFSWRHLRIFGTPLGSCCLMLPPIYPHQWILHKIDASIGPPPIVCYASDVVADFMKVKHTIHNLPSSLW